MKDDSEGKQRDALLRKLRRRTFKGGYLDPADALVAFAPEHGEPAPPVRARLARRMNHRVYPVEGGFLLKWPFDPEEGLDPGHFRREAGGWDHEHCAACNASIHAGDECWFTPRAPVYTLCGRCLDRLYEMKGDVPARPPDAVECVRCGGVGWVEGGSRRCGDCGGLGWRPRGRA